MGAMAYPYANNRLNVPTRIGLVMGMCDIEDIKNTIPFIWYCIKISVKKCGCPGGYEAI
ncbi:hypothetical protein QT349_26215 (plasmid) [Escherichia coli]|nr:hypothetical protein [Escherichia coli]